MVVLGMSTSARDEALSTRRHPDWLDTVKGTNWHDTGLGASPAQNFNSTRARGVCSKRIVALHLIHSCTGHLRVDTTASSDRIWLLSTVIADCNGSSASFDGCLESLFLETSPWPRTPPGFVPLLCLDSRAVWHCRKAMGNGSKSHS